MPFPDARAWRKYKHEPETVVAIAGDFSDNRQQSAQRISRGERRDAPPRHGSRRKDRIPPECRGATVGDRQGRLHRTGHAGWRTPPLGCAFRRIPERSRRRSGPQRISPRHHAYGAGKGTGSPTGTGGERQRRWHLPRLYEEERRPHRHDAIAFPALPRPRPLHRRGRGLSLSRRGQ